MGGTPTGGSARQEYLVQVYKRVFILLVEEYERMRKSVILVGKGPTGLRDAFHGRETVDKMC